MFFAHPVFTPAPPAVAAHVVVRTATPQRPRLPLVAAPRGTPLARIVAVPRRYRFGACQAIGDVAWQMGYTYPANCAQFPSMPAMPLPFGESASAAAWLVALTHELPPGLTVRVDTQTRSIAISPR